MFEELLAEGFDIVAIDFPGFGKSDNPPTPYTIQDYVKITVQLMEKINLPRAIFIGHSFGGRVSIKLAAQYPNLVSKLILVDSAGIQKTTAGKLAKTVIAKALKPFFVPQFMKPVRTKLYQLMGAEDYLATPQIQSTYMNVIKEDLSRYFPKINSETLIVWGENDIDTPVEFAKTMNSSIPNSRLEVLPNAGHFSFLDQKEEFLTVVKKFIV